MVWQHVELRSSSSLATHFMRSVVERMNIYDWDTTIWICLIILQQHCCSSFFFYTFVTVLLFPTLLRHIQLLWLSSSVFLPNARIWPLSLFGVSVPRLNTHIFICIELQLNPMFVCYFLLFVCEYTGLRSLSPRYPSVRLHFCYVYNILYWIETETERLIFMPVFFSLSLSFCSFVLLLVSTAIALISSDCGNVYSHCIRILAPCHNRSLLQWQFHSVFCVLWWFFFFLYSFVVCRFSFFSHLSYHTSHTSALRWIFEHFNATTLLGLLYLFPVHVHNVIILHNILCSVTVRCCAYISLSLSLSLALSLACLLLLLLLLYVMIIAFFAFFALNLFASILLLITSTIIHGQNGTACKIHSKCNAFFGEFYMWLESRICTNAISVHVWKVRRQ